MKPKLKATLARGGMLLVLATAGLALSGGAHAGGTAAGTTISNKATLNYSVGAVPQTSIASSPSGSNNATGLNTDFLVDNKINHAVQTTDVAAISTVPGQTNVVTNFTVTNNGNFAQGYALSVVNGANGDTALTVTDNFDLAAACTINVNGTGLAYVNTLAIDASVPVTVTCAIPSTRVNGDVAVISLRARAAQAATAGATLMTATVGAATAGVDVVFADPAGSDDIVRDAIASARSAYRVVTAALLVTKTVSTVCDPMNGDTQPKNIPGAYVRYTITIANSGAASATLSQITDALSTDVDFDPDLITGTGAAVNCATAQAPQSGAAANGFSLTYAARGAGYTPKYMSTAANGDGATHAAGNITIDFAAALPAAGAYAVGELKTGESVSVTYQVKIK